MDSSEKKSQQTEKQQLPKWSDIVEQEAKETTSMINLSTEKNYEEKKFYVLFNTPRKGIYNSWSTIAPMINGVKGAVHKSYISLEAAKKALAEFEQNQKLKPPMPSALKPEDRKIQTRKEILREIPKRIAHEFTHEVRMQTLQEIRSWKEDDQKTKGFYLSNVSGQSRVVLLPEADPEFAYNCFLMGIIKQVFLIDETYNVISRFPGGLITAIKRYKETIKSEVSIYIRSSQPKYENQQVKIPSISVITANFFAKRFPPMDYYEEIIINDEEFYKSIAEVFKKSQGITERSKVRIAYKSPTCIGFVSAKDPIREEQIREVCLFEEQFKTLAHGMLDHLSKEEKQVACQHLRTFPYHACDFCPDKTSGEPSARVPEERKDAQSTTSEDLDIYV